MEGRRNPKHSVILCHPSAASFTRSVADRYSHTVTGLGHEVVVRDLYSMGFDPVLKEAERTTEHPAQPAPDVTRELEMLAGSDVFVFVYPIWFGMPPAMLMGYVDRVLGAGFSYEAVRERRPHPLMGGMELISFTLSGNSRQWLDEQGAFESLRNVFDTYLRHAFSLANARRVHFSNIVTGVDENYARECLFEVEQAARKICAALLYR